MTVRSWWSWALVLALVVGLWFGWRHSQVLRYQARAHEFFVDEFQNGIRGAYTDIEGARRSLAEGNSARVRERLTDVYHHLQVMQTGATGMSIRLGTEVMPVSVTGRYRDEVAGLQEELLDNLVTQDLKSRLHNLSHDLTLLLELMGDDDQREWLAGATADELNARYQSWRERALIKPEVP